MSRKGDAIATLFYRPAIKSLAGRNDEGAFAAVGTCGTRPAHLVVGLLELEAQEPCRVLQRNASFYVAELDHAGLQ